ncbi:MAG TPA: FAD-binding oxidoreductase [Candidatus Elarobacter sp.]
MIAGADALRIGGRAPRRVVEPNDAAETAAALAAAGAAGECVVVHGGGTLQQSANPPERYDVALLTSRLDEVAAYEPRDLTIGAGAGMTLAALRRMLAQHRQMLPLDAPLPQRATIGGTLAAGWAGPRRMAYGRSRDLLIGATVALVDGTLATTGGMVVKNVTGYDLGKLYIGSHGTLGVLVRANFKLLPAPPAHRLAVSTFDAELRERVIAHASNVAVAPTALLVRDGFGALRDAQHPEEIDFRPQIVALFEGSETTVDRAVREYRSALGAAGIAETRIASDAAGEAAFQAIVDDYVAPAGDRSLTLLARGLPADAPARAQRARSAVEIDVETVTDLLTGDVVARLRAPRSLDAETLAAFGEAVRAALGRAQVLAAHDVAIDAWGGTPGTIETMRALKAQFDPAGTLAPGRFVGGI